MEPDAGDRPEDDEEMYGQQSNEYRHGGGGRGRYLTNPLNGSPVNSMGARNVSLPIAKPPTASHNPRIGATTGQEQGQAPSSSPRYFNSPVIRPPSIQTPQYKPATSGYTKQNYGNQRSTDKEAGHKQRQSQPGSHPSFNRSGNQSFRHQQYSPDKSLTGGGDGNWAHHQEFKIKVLSLPRSCWTQTVYEVLSKYGKIVRIEMQPGSIDCNAWVTFQYVLPLH